MLSFVMCCAPVKTVSSSVHKKNTIDESRDRSSDRGQAHTRFEGGTHENRTERNETSYGIREREREKERYLDLVGR